MSVNNFVEIIRFHASMVIILLLIILSAVLLFHDPRRLLGENEYLVLDYASGDQHPARQVRVARYLARFYVAELRRLNARQDSADRLRRQLYERSKDQAALESEVGILTQEITEAWDDIALLESALNKERARYDKVRCASQRPVIVIQHSTPAPEGLTRDQSTQKDTIPDDESLLIVDYETEDTDDDERASHQSSEASYSDSSEQRGPDSTSPQAHDMRAVYAAVEKAFGDRPRREAETERSFRNERTQAYQPTVEDFPREIVNLPERNGTESDRRNSFYQAAWSTDSDQNDADREDSDSCEEVNCADNEQPESRYLGLSSSSEHLVGHPNIRSRDEGESRLVTFPGVRERLRQSLVHPRTKPVVEETKHPIFQPDWWKCSAHQVCDCPAAGCRTEGRQRQDPLSMRGGGQEQSKQEKNEKDELNKFLLEYGDLPPRQLEGLDDSRVHDYFPRLPLPRSGPRTSKPECTTHGVSGCMAEGCLMEYARYGKEPSMRSGGGSPPHDPHEKLGCATANVENIGDIGASETQLSCGEHSDEVHHHRRSGICSGICAPRTSARSSLDLPLSPSSQIIDLFPDGKVCHMPLYHLWNHLGYLAPRRDGYKPPVAQWGWRIPEKSATVQQTRDKVYDTYTDEARWETIFENDEGPWSKRREGDCVQLEKEIGKKSHQADNATLRGGSCIDPSQRVKGSEETYMGIIRKSTRYEDEPHISLQDHPTYLSPNSRKTAIPLSTPTPQRHHTVYKAPRNTYPSPSNPPKAMAQSTTNSQYCNHTNTPIPILTLRGGGCKSSKHSRISKHDTAHRKENTVGNNIPVPPSIVLRSPTPSRGYCVMYDGRGYVSSAVGGGVDGRRRG